MRISIFVQRNFPPIFADFVVTECNRPVAFVTPKWLWDVDTLTFFASMPLARQRIFRNPAQLKSVLVFLLLPFNFCLAVSTLSHLLRRHPPQWSAMARLEPVEHSAQNFIGSAFVVTLESKSLHRGMFYS
jgi:hypothetical protein